MLLKEKLELLILNIDYWLRMNIILEYSSEQVIWSAHLACIYHTFLVQKKKRKKWHGNTFYYVPMKEKYILEELLQDSCNSSSIPL